MPVTKSVICRYQIINQCLITKFKRYWSLQELRDKLAMHDINISIRTLESDIESMRFDQRLGYLAPISYCPTNKGYYYKDENYSIHKLPLTEEDVETLLKACSFMKAYENLSCISKLPQVIQKIVAGTHLKDLSIDDQPEILIESTLPDKYAGKVNLLLDAIHKGRVVEVVLSGEEPADPGRMILQPYCLHEFEYSWYLAGYTSSELDSVFIDLESIESISVNTEPGIL